MKAYSVFDDFPRSAIDILEKNGISVTVLPKGCERPAGDELKKLTEDYDIVIISTAQKLPEDMLADINSPKIIATASIGVDHIKVPADKTELIRVVNAPKANRISVAEHTFGLILTLRKQLVEGRETAADGKSKKTMQGKPRDLYGSTIGVIGAGGTAGAVLKMASAFGMKRIAWTRSPEKHKELLDDGVEFMELDEVLRKADIISVNLPYSPDTEGLISAERIMLMKDDAIFISISRTELADNAALFKRASENSSFCVGMDVDPDKVCGMWNMDMKNVIVTPHIAGGTIESRKRLFDEVSRNIISLI